MPQDKIKRNNLKDYQFYVSAFLLDFIGVVHKWSIVSIFHLCGRVKAILQVQIKPLPKIKNKELEKGHFTYFYDATYLH